jgi:hypothetical protein
MTTLTATARRLFPAWANMDNVSPMLAQLAQYAAQRPGLDPADYGAHWKQKPTPEAVQFFRSDYRAITRQLQEVREAIRAAYAAQVTDAHLIEAARGTRITLRPDGIEYTTGQFFPIEYRPAVADVIARAARKAQEPQQ